MSSSSVGEVLATRQLADHPPDVISRLPMIQVYPGPIRGSVFDGDTSCPVLRFS